MKFIIIDDQHELYKIMFADMYHNDKYDIEELKPFKKMNFFMQKIHKIHFSDRVNHRFWIPFKDIWNKYYTLNEYNFLDNEEYWIIMLNGTLRTYYSKRLLKKLKEKNKNVKLAMIMYDSISNPYAKRAVEMVDIFDKVFSFDINDCEKMNFEYIYSTLSYPDFVALNKELESNIFFVGSALGRLELLNKCINKINNKVSNTSFFITGVSEKDKIENVVYNKPISYEETLNRAFNTKCLFEVVKPGQTGISLRTCEAILFNKKLITNNQYIKKMPFYNPQYISVFKDENDIDIEFIQNDLLPQYKYEGWFSPINIIESLNKGDTKDDKN